MKKTRFVLLALLFISCLTALSADDFELLYLEGEVDFRDGGRWVPLQFGDVLSENSSIRLGTGAIAEFAGSRNTLIFSRPGTYQLGSGTGRQAEENMSSVVSIFQRLLGEDHRSGKGQSSVMGVRGSEAMEDKGFDWVDEDSANLERAVEVFAAGDYDQAILILEEEVDPIVLDDSGPYWYYLAASHDASGSRGAAIQILRDHEIASFSAVFGDYLFLKGRLALESMSYQEAAEAFEAYVNENADPVRRQLAWCLLGMARLELGDRSSGIRALHEAVGIGADEEVTDLAKALIEG